MTSGSWFVAIWLCVGAPPAGEDCHLVIPRHRFVSELICRQAIEFVVPAELARISDLGWAITRVRKVDCAGPTLAT